MRQLVAIPLVAETKQRRKVSRETKRKTGKTAENKNTMCARLKSVYLVFLVIFCFFDVCPQVER